MICVAVFWKLARLADRPILADSASSKPVAWESAIG
jgi:hypothetical protein